MPTVYKFRVSFEDYDDVSRDIEIKSTQTFDELHFIIQSVIGFDSSKPASFFMATDHWIKDQEISLEKRTDKNGKPLPLMKESRLCDFISDPHQKIYYVSDYDANWTFNIELMKILPQADPMKNYPVCVKVSGDAPKQYIVTAIPKTAIAEEDELAALLFSNDDVDEPEDDIPSDNMMEETEEEGVEMDEIAGMGEEGEEESSEENEEEMGYAEEDDDQKDL